MRRGIVFCFEALIALLLFGTILITIPSIKENSLKELLIIQQENDLLRVWSVDFPEQYEMISDTKIMFDNFELFLDEEKIYQNGIVGENSIASEGIIVDNFLIERKIRIVVHS